MKRYILFLYGSEIEPISRKLEPILSDADTDFRTGNLLFDNAAIISFRSVKTLQEVKEVIKGDEETSPAFILFDGTDYGDNFEMNFGKLEAVILLTKTPELMEEMINDDDLGVDELLDLALKNGFPSLTDAQREKLRKYSEE